MEEKALQDSQEAEVNQDEVYAKLMEVEPGLRITPILKKSEKRIWAVGGGKGGVGKTLVTANLGITLARSGKKVILIDMDLGGANLHTCLGVNGAKFSLGDFIFNNINDIKQVQVNSEINNLSLISGAHDAIGIANLRFMQKMKFISKLNELEADEIILDLGAGTSYNTIDFFLAADVGMVVIIPEPTSIENAYRFIKSAFYRKLRNLEVSNQLKKAVDVVLDERNSRGIKTPIQLIDEIVKLEPEEGIKLKNQVVNQFLPKLIINQVRNQSDIEIGYSVRSVCLKYFGITMDYAGYIHFDDNVWKAVRKRRPLVLEFPTSVLVSDFEKIMRRITEPQAKIPI